MIGEDTVKVAAAVTGAGLIAQAKFGFDPYLMAFIGVPFTVVSMAATGAMLSFAFGSTEENRLRLFGTAIAATLIGAAAVTAIPHFMHWDQVALTYQPVVGFFYALFARWVMPLMIDVLPMLVRRWLNIPAKVEKT